ncbi:methyltransferase domain-containing protein [Pseudonocardia acidicola]|uniref:Methyltransferase domain-containing protein n=1 Tax=Pseudonocardia acidicola TaxID=2724939 RepID=A0ABX1S5U5_9PSEU|nr:methyltransferase domain-containing protein [Pseudonocardia acidicola]NMH96284.1 methyltransferase domain-containing protein [Pseudonocardia acidicola]
MRAVDENTLMEFVGKVVADLGALASAPLVVLGDQLGLYRAMADGEPVTAAELADRTGTAERYVREWLAAQAAGGYVAYDGDGRFHLEPEQAVALTDENSPACVLGGFEGFTAAVKVAPRLVEAFRTGAGIGWDEQDPGLFRGTARFFRPGYAANLVDFWLPALDGVVERLTRGARVADVGCGFGHSTLLMAEAFPASRFAGYDYHPESIEAARKQAAEAGLGDRVSFEVAAATDFPGQDFDLITYFDCLHDMGDPAGALTHAREALTPDGTVMMVEPYAGEEVADNLNPVGRLFYAASTLVCTPASLAQQVGAALGAQAGESRLREVAHDSGFTRFRRAAETPFNLVLEARP